MISIHSCLIRFERNLTLRFNRNAPIRLEGTGRSHRQDLFLTTHSVRSEFYSTWTRCACMCSMWFVKLGHGDFANFGFKVYTVLGRILIFKLFDCQTCWPAGRRKCGMLYRQRILSGAALNQLLTWTFLDKMVLRTFRSSQHSTYRGGRILGTRLGQLPMPHRYSNNIAAGCRAPGFLRCREFVDRFDCTRWSRLYCHKPEHLCDSTFMVHSAVLPRAGAFPWQRYSVEWFDPNPTCRLPRYIL